MAMPKICPLCGPKLSIFCFVMSAWAIIFLGILGLFFYIEAAGLFEDTGLGEKLKHTPYSDKIIEERYRSLAYNCWIASGGYIITLVIALWQNKWNRSLSV